ncbi:MAG: hypothetical protein JOZ01_02240 [Candidatus Eremiobacteraeota bacterium]|nr:hypothetical protein [Candidatus Eremiobacteraeota bacterium]
MSIQPLEGPLSPTPPTAFANLTDGVSALSQQIAPGNLSGDAISRMAPPWLSGPTSNPVQTAMYGPLPGLLQQLVQMLQYMMGTSYGGNGECNPFGSTGGNCAPYGNEQYFQNANGASEGDPHLSFNGNRWNSMVSHPDLLNSDSIPGGFRISTQVTTPNERGITRNQSATVSLDNGQTQISMSNQGQAAITQDGRNVPISAGQTLQLGNGASVTCNRNGSLTVDACNGSGGRIDTTLTAKGQGVNVDVNAHDVDLGGALVRGSDRGWPGPQPGPVANPGPIPGPYATNPIENPFPIVNPIPYDPSQTQSPYDPLQTQNLYDFTGS